MALPWLYLTLSGLFFLPLQLYYFGNLGVMHPLPLPGDPSQDQHIHRIIRVDHAGEYGAIRIYAGQLAVMKQSPERSLIEHMEKQERIHYQEFNELMKNRKVRPTALMPLWHVAGFVLGAGTALLGKKAAFACTAAVESVIDEHYANQRDYLREKDDNLMKKIEKFRQEEVEHHDTSIAQGAENAAFYTVLSKTIQKASKLAIWLSSRV